ncbi:hypothetical protein F5X98DRAFT_58842 [Xylaria grammica]|nr:hypothetical protein F5X98DRAFT_58842 [Xylaria grammica]
MKTQFDFTLPLVASLCSPRTEPVYGGFKRFRSSWRSKKPFRKIIKGAYHNVCETNILI